MISHEDFYRWLHDPAKCKICGHPIERWSASARRSPTGWSHNNPESESGAWQGIRCPGRLTGAQPVVGKPEDSSEGVS